MLKEALIVDEVVVDVTFRPMIADAGDVTVAEDAVRLPMRLLNTLVVSPPVIAIPLTVVPALVPPTS